MNGPVAETTTDRLDVIEHLESQLQARLRDFARRAASVVFEARGVVRTGQTIPYLSIQARDGSSSFRFPFDALREAMLASQGRRVRVRIEVEDIQEEVLQKSHIQPSPEDR